jgi:hypothetical protein
MIKIILAHPWRTTGLLDTLYLALLLSLFFFLTPLLNLYDVLWVAEGRAELTDKPFDRITSS